MSVRAEVTVRGFVQGVGYRRFVQLRAEERNLCGTVINLDNGDVAVVVEGPKESILSYLDDLKRGPAFARVTDLDVTWYESTGQYQRFTIRY